MRSVHPLQTAAAVAGGLSLLALAVACSTPGDGSSAQPAATLQISAAAGTTQLPTLNHGMVVVHNPATVDSSGGSYAVTLNIGTPQHNVPGLVVGNPTANPSSATRNNTNFQTVGSSCNGSRGDAIGNASAIVAYTITIKNTGAYSTSGPSLSFGSYKNGKPATGSPLMQREDNTSHVMCNMTTYQSNDLGTLTPTVPLARNMSVTVYGDLVLLNYWQNPAQWKGVQFGVSFNNAVVVDGMSSRFSELKSDSDKTVVGIAASVE